MHRRAHAIGLALPAITLLAGAVLAAAPASAAVTLPAGCSFNKTTGLSTCTTTTTTTVTEASDPTSYDHDILQGHAGDGSASDFLCTHYVPTYDYYVEDSALNSNYGTLVVTGTRTTTTTTTYQGVSIGKGSKPLTTTAQSTITSATVTQGVLNCMTPYSDDNPLTYHDLWPGTTWSVTS